MFLWVSCAVIDNNRLKWALVRVKTYISYDVIGTLRPIFALDWDRPHIKIKFTLIQVVWWQVYIYEPMIIEWNHIQMGWWYVHNYDYMLIIQLWPDKWQQIRIKGLILDFGFTFDLSCYRILQHVLYNWGLNDPMWSQWC